MVLLAMHIWSFAASSGEDVCPGSVLPGCIWPQPLVIIVNASAIPITWRRAALWPKL
jgi:hypothetical protein